MRITPDSLIFWQHGFFKLNETIVTTWGLMLALALSSAIVTRHLSVGVRIPRWQNLLEIIVSFIREQMEEIGLRESRKYLGFIGTLFIFIAFSNLCTILPFYEPPTASLSTTAALAISVFVAVPFYGVLENGLRGYLRIYSQPTILMLPFNMISEVSRTLALAVRLFGNIMSGTVILAIFLGVAPFFFPLLMTIFGLITGMVQSYIFTVLATVYIAAATRGHEVT